MILTDFIPIITQRGYITKEKNRYIPTQKGLEVFGVLPEELKKADFSAKLEFEFSKMIEKKGRTTREIILEAKELLEKIFTEINKNDTSFSEKNNLQSPLKTFQIL